MAKPLILAQSNGVVTYRDKAGAGSLTAGGAVRYRALASARTNLYPDPHLSGAASAYTGDLASVSGVAAPAAFASLGVATALLITSGAGADAANYFGAYQNYATASRLKCAQIDGGVQYTASAYFYHQSAFPLSITLAAETRPETADAVTVNTDSVLTVVPSGVLTRVSVTFTSNHAASRVALNCYVAEAANPLVAGLTLYVSGAQVEVGAAATPLVSGALGGVWLDPTSGMLGTAHASPSVSQVGMLIEEATTNLWTNPNANSATTGDNSSNSAVLSRDTAFAVRGPSSFKAVAPGSLTAEGHVFILTGFSSQSTRTFIAQAKVRQQVATGGLLMIRLDAVYSDASRTNGVAQNFVGTNGWQQVVSAAVTTDPLKTLNALQLYVVTRTSVQAITFNAGDIQIEEKAYATSFAQGDMGTGLSWQATAHASASIRAVTTLKVDETGHLNPATGAIAMKVLRMADTGAAQRLLDCGDGTVGKDRFLLSIGADDKVNLMYQTNNGSTPTAISAESVPVGSWSTIFGDWTALAHRAKLGTNAAVSIAHSASQGNISSANDMTIGGSAAGASAADAVIGSWAVFDGPLTDAEYAKLTALDQWTWTSLDAALGVVMQAGQAAGTPGLLKLGSGQ